MKHPEDDTILTRISPRTLRIAIVLIGIGILAFLAFFVLWDWGTMSFVFPS